jgi:hypothetical protein
VKTDRQRSNWIVDATLFAGFIITFWLDLTGVILHQWLGIAVAVLAGYHLITHWAWVKSTTHRLLQGASGKGRRFYLVDAGVMLGMFLMVATGIVISTWLALPLGSYMVWRNAHVAASIATLLLVVLKIGMHWRWVVTVARRYVFPSRPERETQPAAMPLPVRTGTEPHLMGRREFLKVMGIVSVTAAVPVARVLLNTRDASAEAVAELSPDSSAGGTESQSPAQQGSTTAAPSPAAVQASDTCVVRCNRRCSYPGLCGRYTDTNQNGRCDKGECS